MPDGTSKLQNEYIEKEIEQIKKRLDNHSDRLKQVEGLQISLQTDLKHLINQLSSLINMSKIIFTALLSFFIWYIQKL